MSHEKPITPSLVADTLHYMCNACNRASRLRGWWHHPKELGGAHLLADHATAPYVVATKIALVSSEVFEGFEGYRRGLPDDKLPQFDALTVELADVLIRVFDLAGELNLPVADAVLAKMAFNEVREDHSVEARRQVGGKLF